MLAKQQPLAKPVWVLNKKIVNQIVMPQLDKIAKPGELANSIHNGLKEGGDADRIGWFFRQPASDAGIQFINERGYAQYVSCDKVWVVDWNGRLYLFPVAGGESTDKYPQLFVV